jgi:hypothetical protein
MTILFSSGADIPGGDNFFGSMVSQGLDLIGFPQSDSSKENKLISGLEAVRRQGDKLLEELVGKDDVSERNYIGSGRHLIVEGSHISGGETSPVEEANVRQVYTQSPAFSIVIKKRAFSSLSHLFDPTLMDSAEKWLFRATKKLIELKCVAIAEYERISKLERMLESGTSAAVILSTIISSYADDSVDVSSFGLPGDGFKATFDSTQELRKLLQANIPPNISTYYKDPDSPSYPELGGGTGTFELTVVSNVDTSLGLDGSGSCNFIIEDPYRLLNITEQDIEIAINQTSKSAATNPLTSRKINSLLESAQAADEALSKSRKDRGKSPITFTADAGSTVSAVIDAIGFPLDGENFDDVPEAQALNTYEKSQFRLVHAGLDAYLQMIKSNILRGLDTSGMKKDREQREYVLKRMRTFYLGKTIIQPMDSIHVLISGGLRRMGEGEDLDSLDGGDITTLDGAIKTAASILSHYDDSGDLSNSIPDELLKREYDNFRQYGKAFLGFEDFKKLRTIQLGDAAYIQVFGGLVKNVSSSFSVDSGKHLIAVGGDSNMEWLRLSRFNTQPSLDQTQGFVYDPFSPFKFEVDPASGLPIGKPKLLPENEALLRGGFGENRVYFDSGPKKGKLVLSLEDLEADVQKLGGNLKRLLYHAPGLKYRWKEGIMTAIYDMSTTNPRNGNTVSYKELVRDVGLFTSNTPFDNMDSANVISILVTGQPYNFTTFVQSAINNGTFTADTSLNGQKTYFSSMLDIQNSFIRTHGNFQPYKLISTHPQDLAKAMLLQQKLTGASSEINQLRTEYTRLADQICNLKLSNNTDNQILIDSLKNKRIAISDRIDELTTNFSELTKAGDSLQDNIIKIAGDDISFDLVEDFSKNSKLFGDRLYHATLKQRSDIVYNKDKNYLIISDEYDKDHDIQAFVLELSKQLGTLWSSTWQSVDQICKSVSEILNFEFFVNTQGHLEFRPPQYNRVPFSVLAAMVSYHYNSGVKIFPDFLLSLFKSRESSIIDDVVIIEWKIKKYAALLGKTSFDDVQQFLSSENGTPFVLLIATDPELGLQDVISGNKAIDSDERKILQRIVKHSNYNVQTKSSSKGLFTSKSQYNAYNKIVIDDNKGEFLNFGYGYSSMSSGVIRQAAYAYNKAAKQIAKLTGQQISSSEEFSKVEVGAKQNGMSTPATDISNYISKIAELVSQRSRLLRTLERILEQNVEIQELTDSMESRLGTKSINNMINLFKNPKGNVSGIYDKLVEDDSKDLLGHLSSQRFIIRDENIISSSFSERPPEFTTVVVDGKEPLIGEGSGNIAGIPMHKAYGVDYDTWRQYGWRSEKPFDKPFFWSADKQCAPYALMLLSRERKNILTGSITVIGNEFYQLGDVVYVVERQMLYYVNKISHRISFRGEFTTNLDLVYGHPVGEYIPTPLDIMGKLSAARSGVQNSYRIRREKSRSNVLLGVVKFPNGIVGDKATKQDMLTGEYGLANYNTLVNASILAQGELDDKDLDHSSRIFVMTYNGKKDVQSLRRQSVMSWFRQPEKPSAGNDGSLSSFIAQPDKDVKKFIIQKKFLYDDHIRLRLPRVEKFTQQENELLTKYGMTASQEALTKDPTLETVVEIRLCRAPSGGWDF